MKFVKKVSAVTSCILICTALTANAAVKLYVNGYRINKNIILESGTTYLP